MAEVNPNIFFTALAGLYAAKRDKLLAGRNEEELARAAYTLLSPDVRKVVDLLNDDPDVEWTEFDAETMAATCHFTLDRYGTHVATRLSPQMEALDPANGRSPYFSAWSSARIAVKNSMPCIRTDVEMTWPMAGGEAALYMLGKYWWNLLRNHRRELAWVLLAADIDPVPLAAALGVPVPE